MKTVEAGSEHELTVAEPGERVVCNGGGFPPSSYGIAHGEEYTVAELVERNAPCGYGSDESGEGGCDCRFAYRFDGVTDDETLGNYCTVFFNLA